MNRTIVIFHILVSTITIAKSIDEATIKAEDDNREIALNLWSADGNFSLTTNDDVLKTSDINNMYTPLETKVAKNRSLKEEIDNDNFSKADINKENQVKSKPNESLEYKKSGDDDKIGEKTKATRRSESKDVPKILPASKVEDIKSTYGKDVTELIEKNKSSSEVEDVKLNDGREKSQSVDKSNPPPKTVVIKSKDDNQSVEKNKSSSKEEDFKSKDAKEETKSIEKSVPPPEVEDVASKDGKKESKLVENFDHIENKRISDKLNDVDSTTTTTTVTPFTSEERNTDYYLENDSNDSSDNFAPIENFEKKRFPINYESNTAWDLLDDMLPSRRMFSQPDDFNKDYKEKPSVKNFQNEDSIEEIFGENVVTPRNSNQHVSSIAPVMISQLQSKPVIPHTHISLLPGRRLIGNIPRIHPPFPIDYRRLNQARNIEDRQNLQLETDHRFENNNFRINQNNDFEKPYQSDVIKDVEDYNSKEESNAYAYAPAVSVASNPSEVANSLFAKLIDASEHPQRLNPNFNVQPIPNVPFNNNLWNNYFAIPVYKYVNGFWR
ncbi:cylicin-1-like [Bicyclus anynana]|uniref:Cylicin-1-like n=1 Tax=Bicyclus anynana TaxID=110368 RepID=A0A6J1N788_BICAN|nr:cylicin-1-like [Bicyclus anynana]